MNGPEQFRRALKGLLGALGESLMVVGGRDMYLASQQDHLPYEESCGSFGLVFLSAWDGPLPGHPERLRPGMPLTAQEQLLTRDLAHLNWPPLKGRW